MRNISFSKTTQQVRDRQKTVTRRAGTWKNLKPGDRLMAVEKGMGLKPGEKVVRLGVIEIVSNTPEPLQEMIDDPVYGAVECVREGFRPPHPKSDPAEFVRFFCKFAKITADEPVQRIEFRYL